MILFLFHDWSPMNILLRLSVLQPYLHYLLAMPEFIIVLIICVIELITEWDDATGYQLKPNGLHYVSVLLCNQFNYIIV